MKALKLLHIADLHYCQKHLKHVDAAVGHAIEAGVAAGCQVAIIAGDSFDSSVHLHEPAVDRFFQRIKQMAEHMPVLVLQGTFSHDRPGAIGPLRHIGGRHPVYVADRITQVALVDGEWVEADAFAFAEPPSDATLVASCLPSINKGAIAAAVGVDNAGEKAGELVRDLCSGWAVTNKAMRTLDVPTVLVAHGTVNGAVTETAHSMVSNDHEFSTGALFAAETSSVLLGHIHNHQTWVDGRRIIAYPGSITKLIYGHKGTVGALLWDLDPDGGQFELVETPSRRRIEFSFQGTPDMEELTAASKDAAGAYVRIRYSIDEEHRSSVDNNAMRALFSEAAEVKIEGHINPIQRVRAAGISQAKSLAEQLQRWCEVTETESGPLVDRLALAEHKTHQEIIEGVTA